MLETEEEVSGEVCPPPHDAKARRRMWVEYCETVEAKEDGDKATGLPPTKQE